MYMYIHSLHALRPCKVNSLVLMPLFLEIDEGEKEIQVVYGLWYSDGSKVHI